jgi:hypothetical protein
MWVKRNHWIFSFLPDLPALDIELWCYLKNKVYLENTQHCINFGINLHVVCNLEANLAERLEPLCDFVTQ